MARWLVFSLLIVFVLHLLTFGVLALKRKDKYYTFVSITFFLLSVSFSMRLWAPPWKLGGIQLYWFPRVAAWLFTLLSISLWVQRRKQKSRAAESQPG